MGKKYLVTQSISPNTQRYCERVRETLESHNFSNNGPNCLSLEKALADYIGTPNIALCANGTLGLEIAIHAAGLAGSTVITTPFTYVATISALLWVGCKIIFADIEEESLSISPAQIEQKMTPAVQGILPVNVYGHPCDNAAISRIARESGCATIYDAAQAFGASLNGKSLLLEGDFSICSFHATKTFHTLEGGMVISKTREGLEKLRLLRAFGHYGDTHYCLGINAKMSELHAAMGLELLQDFEAHRQKRKKLSLLYAALLAETNLRTPSTPPDFLSNYSYFPVIFATEKILLKTISILNANGIFPRRYFYPALNTLPYIHYQNCPVAEDIAPRILCLPLYSGLLPDEVEKIAELVKKNCR